jgi:hypothetical protein
MFKSAIHRLGQTVRWLPFALLVLTVVDPGIWQPAWWLIESTGDAVSNHANRLAHELSWRPMTGRI